MSVRAASSLGGATSTARSVRREAPVATLFVLSWCLPLDRGCLDVPRLRRRMGPGSRREVRAAEVNADLRAVERAARHAREYLHNRDLAIKIAYANGHSLRTIADVAELSHAAIAKIVNRRAPR